MKKLPVLLSLSFLALWYLPAAAQLNLLGNATNGATNAANSNANNGGTNAVNNGVNSLFGSKKNNNSNNNTTTSQPAAQSTTNQQQTTTAPASSSSTAQANAATEPAPDSYKTYSNYDFVPGDTIIFADDFADDQDGEFPAHWNLDAGQAILNKVINDEALALTEGNYALVSPRMKTENYLTSSFTIEFDYYANNGYGPILRLLCAAGNNADVQYLLDGGVSTGSFTKDFSAPYPGQPDGFRNLWHHAAFIYKNNQIKCYVDQYRVLVMPNITEVPVSFQLGGIGGSENPILLKNVRVASGGSMNSIHQKFTDSKIVTHGINFDIDKAIIKPESMGTLNMIVKILNQNPDLKFEVDGHTDNSGSSQHNLTLSQQRADAVKKQLQSMGIDSSRLKTKGFGDSKPISSNDSPEGKANNRRVEFVKI